ncbi:MAG: hypothetical protein JSR45_07190 [Proteobacteria bacterium]|nr:hypothetical protein [Pseudomonadota bacterium]
MPQHRRKSKRSPTASGLLRVAYAVLFLPIVAYGVAYQSGGREWPRAGAEKGAFALSTLPAFALVLAFGAVAERWLGYTIHPLLLFVPAGASMFLIGWAVEGPGQAMAKRIRSLPRWQRRGIGIGTSLLVLASFFGACTLFAYVNSPNSHPRY